MQFNAEIQFLELIVLFFKTFQYSLLSNVFLAEIMTMMKKYPGINTQEPTANVSSVFSNKICCSICRT